MSEGKWSFDRPLSTYLTSFFSSPNKPSEPKFDGTRAMKGSKGSGPTIKPTSDTDQPIVDPKFFPFPIYCINLRSSTARRDRMYQRFTTAGLLDKVTFVDGIAPNMPIVDHYLASCPNPYGTNVTQHRRDGACYASHIKALRRFLENPDADACLICEDDILLDNHFIPKFQQLYYNLPAGAPLLCLTWMIDGPIEQVYVGKNIDVRNLWKIDPEHTWGAQAYYITRDYALRCIDAFDRSHVTLLKHLDINKVTSEIIIRRSGGYMAAYPIVIEDCIDSDRATQDIPFHLRHFCRWDYACFINSDPERLSPLAKMSPSNSWPGYPFEKRMEMPKKSDWE